MLYTLIHDHYHFLESHFDDEQMWRILEEYGDEHINNRVDVNNKPESFSEIVKEPLKFSFPVMAQQDNNKPIPDIDLHSGRLLLSQKAYDALNPLIESDGDFMPAVYQSEHYYFFIPMRVAQINSSLTHKNEWDEIISIGFDEEETKDWALFRTEYNGYMSLYCQQSIVDAIEQANLTGLYITNDLANIFPEDRSDVVMLNS